MAESEPDPREYRGGTSEDKGDGADTEGIVPREELDNPPPQQTDDPQALKDEALGEVTGNDDSEAQVDRSAGDEADATRLAGTQDDVEDLEEGKPVSRVDQPNLVAQTDEKGV